MSKVPKILTNLSEKFEAGDLVGTLDVLKHVVIGNASFVQVPVL
jgi:hypothetical protein